MTINRISRNDANVIAFALFGLLGGCGNDDPAPMSSGPTKPAVAPRDGLVAEYLFSGNANDTGGGGNDGVVNGATPTTDRFGNADAAYEFNGDDNIAMPNGKFQSGNAVSVSVWVRFQLPPSYFLWCSEFGFFLDAVGDNDPEDGMNTSYPVLGFAVSFPNTEGEYVQVERGGWVHLLGTYDGSDIVMYMNDQKQFVVHHPGTIYEADAPLNLGGSVNNFFTGALDDLRIYNRAITDPKEIYALYHEGGF